MSDAIDEARRVYFDALSTLNDQRRQIEEDLKFANPSDPDQWEPVLKQQRETDPGGARPCLVFDHTNQYIGNVAGQIEQRPPSLHALPVDGGADRKVAEQLDGFFRHIEHASRAPQHYARALQSAARCGVGYLTARPEYINRALNWQEPRIGSQGDPLKVIFDPYSVELDGCDASFAFELNPMSQRDFEREFPGKEKVSFVDEEGNLIKREDDVIVVADYWRVERKKRTMCVCLTDTGDQVALTQEDYALALESGRPVQKVSEYQDNVQTVRWGRMSGSEPLVEETEFPADSIGIVPVYGYVAWSGGRMQYCGIPRRAMHAQRAYNYHMSEIQAHMATAPKAPWTVPVRAIKGLEPLWDKASVEQRAYLPYHDLDDAGAIAAPSRPNPSVNLQNHMAGADRALQDIQAAVALFQANLGAPSNEQSGVAIDARKEQGEASNAHFPAHLAAGVGQIGKLVMQMIPRLIDQKRQLRILGLDGSVGKVTLDPRQPTAIEETPNGLSINPNTGQYDVRVTVGAAFTTQRQQAQTAFTEMMRANPAMTPALAPLWAQTLDVPNADKLAQVLTAVAPPEVKAILQPNDNNEGPTTAELTTQVQQLSQALQAAVEEAHQAQQELDQAQAEAESLKADKELAAAELQIKGAEVGVKEYDAETKRIQAEAAAEQARQAAQLAALQAAHAMDTPDEPAEPVEAPEPVEAEPDPRIDQVVQGQQALLEQGQQVGMLLKELIRLVQAPRKREPIYDKNGEISGSVDKIDLSPQTLQ